jgi:hypothetical protein
MPAESLDLSAAAALIPFWVRWGGVAAAILTALLTAGIGGAIATYITLYRVRRLGDVEWPERARVTYIARQAISACVVTLALIAGGIAWIFAGPFSAISAWGLVGLTWTVAMAVGLSWRRYVAQRTRADAAAAARRPARRHDRRVGDVFHAHPAAGGVAVHAGRARARRVSRRRAHGDRGPDPRLRRRHRDRPRAGAHPSGAAASARHRRGRRAAARHTGPRRLRDGMVGGQRLRHSDCAAG